MLGQRLQGGVDVKFARAPGAGRHHIIVIAAEPEHLWPGRARCQGAGKRRVLRATRVPPRPLVSSRLRTSPASTTSRAAPVPNRSSAGAMRRSVRTGTGRPAICPVEKSRRTGRRTPVRAADAIRESRRHRQSRPQCGNRSETTRPAPGPRAFLGPLPPGRRCRGASAQRSRHPSASGSK